MDQKWTDCERKTCCPGYILLVGQCVPEDTDPCSMNLCEQKCSVFFGRVVCTCFAGYKFNLDKHKAGISPACDDIDECNLPDEEGTVTGKADCEQVKERPNL